jgi:hypothetical protein
MRLDKPDLDTLRTLQFNVVELEASLAVARAEMQKTVATMFAKHTTLQGKHLICLHCGMFYLAGREHSCSD